MKTFHSARLKLTIWYMLLSMIITMLFTVVIYVGITRELNRMNYMQQLNRQNKTNFFSGAPAFPPRPELDIQQAKMNILLILLGVNGIVLLLSGGAGYLLAGRTLRPIKEMMEEQSRFITDASHELKTPLTAIRTEFEVAMRKKHASLVEAEKLIKSSYEEILSLQGLTESLLELTQQQRKLAGVYGEAVSLLEVMEGALKKIIPLAKQKQIVIHNEVDDYLLSGDQKSLTELFVILLDNAIKYSPEKSTVRLLSKKTDHHVQISVSDNGIGISKKDLEHIFDRFYRVDKSRSKTQGYGLGLSIAKEIVISHKGTIHVESEISKGTTFTVQIPLKKSA